MAISAPGLIAEVWAGYVAVMPTAAGVVRSNLATGVAPHNPAQMFVTALCTAWASVLPTLPILASVTGTADIPGITPIPVPVILPGIPAAVAGFLATPPAWVGPAAVLVADAWIGGLLRATARQGLLFMQPSLTVGTGVGVVSPATNPNLAAQITAGLAVALPAAFTATGCFGTNDLPGAPVNPILVASLPRYAQALAAGFATVVATPGYIGTGTVPIASTGVSSGFLL